jgi:hypothetical protein
MALIFLKLGFTLNNNSGIVVRKGAHAPILWRSSNQRRNVPKRR